MAAVPSVGRAARVERPAERGSDATRDLYERFSGQIFGYCLHQLGSREEAEDAVQTTFMNAFRGLQRGIVPEIESAWLFKIAHNVCLSRRRSTWRRGKVEAPNNFEVLQEVVPARERIGDELFRLQDVLEEMPESQRRAILLREWQGLSYREIAAELGLTQSAVETLIFRARRALASGLEVEPPQRTWRRRARHGLDAGGLVAALKALLTGGTAVKVAATIAVATTAAVAASAGHHHAVRHTRISSAPRAIRASSVRVQRTRVTTVHHATQKVTVRTARAPTRALTQRAAGASTSPAATSSVAPEVSALKKTSGNGKSQDAKPAKSPEHQGAAPGPAAKGNQGKGHDKHSAARATQDARQSAPAQGQTEQSGASSEQDGEQHGNGNG